MAEILVIRQRDRFSSIFIEQGFSVTNFPTITTKPFLDLSELENCLEEIGNFDGIFITSKQAAEILLAKLAETQTSFSGKIYVLGEKSRRLFENARLKTFFSEKAKTAEELLRSIPENELKGKRFLFPKGTRSLRVIPEKLKNIADVREVEVYKTVATDESENQSDKIKGKLKNAEFTAICFFSPSGVEGFLERFPDYVQNEITIAAIGTTTANCIEEKKLRADFVSAKPDIEDYALGLIEYLRTKI